jgi:hypothetical protein
MFDFELVINETRLENDMWTEGHAMTQIHVFDMIYTFS